MATPYSPLRPRGDTFTALDRAEDRFGEEQDVARGLVRTLTSMTASGLADEALRREAAGQAGWEDRRDAALATQREAAAYAPRISSLRDAAGLGDVVDFIQGAAPGAAASTLPSLGAALLTRGRWRPAAFVGAAVPSYLQSRGEIAAEQYIDPVLSQASAEERDRAATYGGAAMAALDTVLPGSLANSALRKPARDFLSQTGRAAVTEGLTETAQTGIQQFAHNTIDPTRGYDVWEMLDAGVAGAVGGAGLAGAMRAPSYAINALSSRAQPAQNDAAPIDLNPPSDPMEGAPPGTSPLPTPDDGSGGVGDLFDTLNERFGPGIREQAQRTKDYVSDTIDRMTEAAKTAQSPDEFLRQVFGNSAEEAAADLRPDTEDPIVLNAADPAAALQQRSAERQQRAARFAEELLNDPATPDAVKERVASFGGDFSNPEAQAFVARNLVAQRAGEKIATAVMDLIALSKDFGTGMATKARDMLDEGMTAAADRIVKRNLQDVTPAEQAAFNKLIFDSLTDEAKANPTVRQHLPEIANAMLAFAARTGELTKDDLKTLSRMKDGLAIFRDPDALAAQLTEYAGLPRPEDSFLSRIKRITNAQQDIRRPNSFLYYSLTEKAKDTLSSAELNGLARLVDDFSIIDADKEQGDKVLAGLIAAFGSKESAQAVLDYYRQQNRADLRFDLNETLQEDGSNPMKEVDAPKASYHFADAKSMRPFRAFVGHMTSEGGMRRRLREATIAGVALRRSLPGGARVRPVKMSQYVADTGRDPEVEVRRIANDIKDRIAQHEARKDEDRTKQINELRGELTLLRRAYKDGGAQAALDLYEVLEVSGQEQSDTIATDEDIAKMATLANAKDAKETRVTFQREDGSKFTLSAESMWKTRGDKEGSGKGENAQVRAKRLFADAVASVLARPEVAKMVTPMENILIDRKLGVRAKRKDNPKYRKMVADALKAAEDSLKQLEATLDAVVEEYLDAADNEAKSEEYGSRREEIESIIEKNIAQLSERLDAARDGKGPLAGNKPAQAVARQKLRMYREAQNQIDAIKFDEEFDERDSNRSGIPGADKTGPLGPYGLPRTRMNEELGNAGPRFAEEDTGIGVGVEKRGPKSEPSAQKKENEPKTISEAAFNALYDIAVKGNYGRLDTPEKVLRYAAMAREMMDRLAQIPRGARSDRQQELLSKLRADFKQDGNAAFDWDKLFDGMKPTDEQRALLKDIVANKNSAMGAEDTENTSRSKANSSKMGGRPGRPGKDWGDKDAVKAEILRLRGKDVKVRVEKLVKQLGGSGQYTYNPKTGERLIEVAINARSPLGTARHEAMHDLFRFLSENEATRSIARDLRDATSAPHVIRRLRELLKDHKAALEQLSDPEERAAYAYQFWAEGLLQIGPTGTGIFNTIRQFIKDLFGIVTASQRGEDLMRAFHDGKFADPSIVQEVLQDINDRSGDRLSNKMNRAAPALTRALNAIFSAAPNRLRRFENDYLNQLADKFQPESGTGFIQNKFQQEGVWMNRLATILRGTTAVERREAIDQLQSMNPTSKLAKELLKFNEDIYEYMRDAGVQSWDSDTKKFVPLRKVQGYFARSWDPDAIARNRTEFEALLRTEGGVSAANAAALTENLIRGSEQRPKPKESPVDLGFMPYAPHTSERVLTFIKPSNADKFAKFQRKDLADIMTSYIRGATHRAEYARAFGNNGEKIVELVAKSGIRNPEELNEISNAVQAMEGSLDPGNWSVQTKEAMSALMTLQNVTLLPLALVSQMIDPIVLAARTGDLKDAGTAYVTALKRLKNTITKSNNKVPGEELAEILGVVSEDSTLQALSMAYGATRMSKRMENINRIFFKYNGMQGWNNSMRIAATAAGEKYLLAHKNDARALAELGLEPKDIKSVNGKLDISNPKVQQAMFQFVDQAVLRPSAANRPVWMSDPRFLLVAHLKQFTFAMHNVVLKRANRELQNDNPKPWGILMLAMPVILAADMAKFALTGTTPSTWGFKDYLVHAVERAGLLGLGDFGVQATRGVGMGKMPGEELLGPTFENLMEILRWISGDPRTSLGDVIDRTVPGSRFI